MENSLPKTNQNPNRFRVARNVQPTTDGRIIPRSSYFDIGGPSDVRRFTHLKQYGDLAFVMAAGGSVAEYKYFLNIDPIPKSSFQGGSIVLDSDNTSNSVMSYRKNNTLYVLSPQPQSFFKYDGVEVTGCGSPMPRFSCAEHSAVGTDYIKVIQHRIDFDNNEPVSETVTFPILASTNTITIRTDSGATPINVQSNVVPGTFVQPESNDMNDLFFIGTAVYNGGTDDYTITASETNITADNIGGYVFIGNATGTPYYWSATDTGTGNYKLIALKVKSVSPLVLDNQLPRVIELGEATWKFGSLIGATIDGLITMGFRKMFTVWGSDSATGKFTLRRIYPAFPESSAAPRTFTADTTVIGTSPFSSVELFPLAIGLNLGDWYDVNSRKLCLSSDYDFGGTTGFYGITTYQDQLVWWNDDLIYFSDPTLAGSVEHPSSSSYIRVGDSEDGVVVSCCGNQDFLIVSRQRQNYIVTGNLATGNYRVQDIADIELGAWCNNGTISIKDSVILINATGVWQIQGGGRATLLSGQIPQNFSTYDGYTQNSDVAFRLNGYSTLPIEALDPDTGLDIIFDEYREYLIFCQRSQAGTPALVMHTKTGEWYEWNGLNATGLRSMLALNGVVFFGSVDATTYTASLFGEFAGSMDQDYASTYPIKLYSTWLTAGEPSLEKQLLQLKMFGAIHNDGSDSINVVHFKDWQSTKITNSSYIPDSATQYSHLKRLNSDKVLAASVGIEVDVAGVTFELESFEVEFNPIQQGVKR